MKNKKRNPSERAETSKYNPIPLYRSYGKTKKEYELWERFLALLEKIFTIVFLGLIFYIIAVSVISWMIYGGVLVRTLVTVVTITVLSIYFTKTIRKRHLLYRKLKKACAANHYDLNFERPFFKSLKWSKDQSDITIITSHAIFYIHLLAVPSYRSILYFDSASEMRIVKPPLKNKFSVIFDFKTKVKKISLDFSDARKYDGKITKKIILVNPVCNEMHYKVSEISTSQTGNGGEHFGYQIFTATGFINYLSRFENDLYEKSKISH